MAAFRLRFLVFNLELNEGLDTAYATGHDTDEFDAFCDHLIVKTSALRTLSERTGSRAVLWPQ